MAAASTFLSGAQGQGMALAAACANAACANARELTRVLSQLRKIYEGETEKPTPHHFHPIVMERHDAIVATATEMVHELARLDRSRRHFRRAAAP